MYHDRKLEVQHATNNPVDSFMRLFRSKTRKSSWFIGTSPLALAACGGGVEETSDGPNLPSTPTSEDSSAETNGLVFETFDTVRVANLPYGESNAIVDINFDGQPEWFLMPSSTRNSNHPIFKDAEILTLDLENSNIVFNSTFVPQLDNCSWSDTATFCGVTVRNPTSVIFDGEWLQVGWTQDVQKADFNGDGITDLFVSGHGREWPENWSGSDSSSDYGQLLQEPGFTDYPGDLIQIVLAGQNPKVIQVSEFQAFWHSARIGDFDGDGDPDVIATTTADPFNKTPSLELYQNDGLANFSKFPLPAVREGEPNADSIWFGATVVDMADLDNDGVDEIILPGSIEPDDFAKKIYIYDYNGTEIVETGAIEFPTVFKTVGEAELDLSKLSIDKLNTGDYDNDGDIDMIAKFVSSDTDATGHLYGYLGHVIFENTGLGYVSFMYETQDTLLQSGDGAWFIDIDGDDDLDVVHTGWPGNEDAASQKWHRDVTTISDMIWINQGNNQFVQLSSIQTPDFQLKGLNNTIGEDYKIIHWNVAEYADTNYFFIVGLDEIETSVLEVMTLSGDFVV